MPVMSLTHADVVQDRMRLTVINKTSPRGPTHCLDSIFIPNSFFSYTFFLEDSYVRIR